MNEYYHFGSVYDARSASRLLLEVIEIPKDGPDREALSKDPYEMFRVSLSRRERLPEDLHQAMIMWSFHPHLQAPAKMYVEWIDFLEEKETPAQKSGKRNIQNMYRLASGFFRSFWDV